MGDVPDEIVEYSTTGIFDPVLDSLAKFGTSLEIPGLLYHQIGQSARQGRLVSMVQFAFLATPQWRGIDVERLLKRRFGIQLCDRNFRRGRQGELILMFCVHDNVANWVDYILRRNGVQVLSIVHHPSNLAATGRGPIPQRNADQAIEIIDGLLYGEEE